MKCECKVHPKRERPGRLGGWPPSSTRAGVMIPKIPGNHWKIEIWEGFLHGHSQNSLFDNSFSISYISNQPQKRNALDFFIHSQRIPAIIPSPSLIVRVDTVYFTGAQLAAQPPRSRSPTSPPGEERRTPSPKRPDNKDSRPRTTLSRQKTRTGLGPIRIFTDFCCVREVRERERERERERVEQGRINFSNIPLCHLPRKETSSSHLPNKQIISPAPPSHHCITSPLQAIPNPILSLFASFVPEASRRSLAAANPTSRSRGLHETL